MHTRKTFSINSIQISLYDISLTQNILYQIKRDVAVLKRLGCPQRNQRTWWQIVATPYTGLLVCDLNRTPIVMAEHGVSCVHFSGISICGRISRQTVSHPQRPPLLTLCKISLPVYVIVTNERLQPLTTKPGIIHWCYLFRCWKFNDVELNTGVFCAPCIVESGECS